MDMNVKIDIQNLQKELKRKTF